MDLTRTQSGRVTALLAKTKSRQAGETGPPRSPGRRPRRPPSPRPRRPRGRRGRRRRRASPGGGRRGRRWCRRAGRRCRVTTKPSSVASIVGAEAAQAVDDGGDPVGLLDAQLGGARAPRSRPRRSSRAARRAAARRSRAGPRAARPWCPSSGPEATSSSQTGSSCGISPGRGGSRSPTTTAPMRSAIRTKPVRVQFALMSVMTIREPLTRIAGGDVEGRRRRVAGHVDRAELELVVLGELDAVAVAR